MTGFKQSHFRKLLVMDTSTAVMSVAILDGDQLLGESNEIVERNHSTRLIPAIQELVASTGLKMKDIDGVASGRGPGSYTGVRISVTVAKTLAWSLQIPLIGVSSLEALAYGAVDWKICDKVQTQWIIPLMDARRGQVYTGLYGAAAEQHWQCHIPDGIRLMESWVEQLISSVSEMKASQQPKQIIFIGETDSFHERIQQFSKSWVGEVVLFNKHLRAFDLGKLAQRRWTNGDQEEVHHFVPNYTQLAEAEAKLMANRK